MSAFDVVVIGCGPAGERAAIYAARAGKRVAVIEAHNVVGGARVNWGTIPSKTLRESAMFIRATTEDRVHGMQFSLERPLTIADFMHHEREVVQRELELINRSLDKNLIEVFRGRGRFIDEHKVAIIGSDGAVRGQVTGEVIVISTGSSPNHPADISFERPCCFDSDGVLSLSRIPRSLLVIGAGVIGVEYTSIFTALGVEVTLLDARPDLLPYLDRELATILEREMRRNGAVLMHGDHYERVETYQPDPGRDEHRVRCTTKNGNILEADALLYTAGRDGNTRGLNLGAIGVTANARGLLQTNEFYQLAAETQPHIYAVGDVIGYPALASTSMEQGRQAMRHAFGIQGQVGGNPQLPFAIYAIPELSYIGETEEELTARGQAYVAGRGHYALNPKGQIIGDTGGLLKLLFDADSDVLLGVHIVGSQASELIHTGQAYLRLGATAEQIAESIFNYPTLADLYRHAALEVLAKKRRPRADAACSLPDPKP